MEGEILPTNIRIFLRAIACCAKIGDELFIDAQNDGAFIQATKVYQVSAIVSDSRYFLNIKPGGTHIEVGLVTNEGIVRRKAITLENLHTKHAISNQKGPGIIRCNPGVFDHPLFKGVAEVEMQFKRDTITMTSFIDADENRRKFVKSAITLRIAPPQFESYTLPSDDEEYQQRRRTADEEVKEYNEQQQQNNNMNQKDKQRGIKGRGNYDLNEEEEEDNNQMDGSYMQQASNIESSGIGMNSMTGKMQPIKRKREDIREQATQEPQNVTLVFCMKEFKSLLQFTTSIGSPITIIFEKPGKPLIITMEIDRFLKADFVLATLLNSEDQGEESQTQQQQ
ncbi:MAG: hypothetical protein EZS28_009281 [Streblomastix strix]|uniref:Uncharacterized protein n=1 Tax=Streblomastix strix TaxID=222440 RepID=A0A5J4WKX2_9EUKA|nr:MAG: hypothetical protein EZS28_009281 [Streblomastix strix]